MKITKPAHAFKGFARNYRFEILDFFDLELQIKDAESAIENKIKKLLSQLSRFKFVTILVLMFKKIESEDKTKYGTFYSY